MPTTNTYVFENEATLNSKACCGSDGGGGVITSTPIFLSPLDSALAIARKGFKVLPVWQAEKKPHIENWPELATTDEKQIRKWWKKWPNANIGIATRGLLVIDVDGPIGQATLARIQRIAKLTPTAISRSGCSEAHHYHLIYRLPEHQFILNKKIGQFAAFAALGLDAKLDIRANGGYIVAPGSKHPDGGIYAWETEPETKASLPLAPFWLTELLSEDEAARKPRCKQNATEGQEEALPVIDDRGLFPQGEILILEKDFDFYAKQTVKRYHVDGPGQRNAQMAAAVASLFHRGLHPKDVIRVMVYWLKAHQDQYATDYETARDELLDCLDRTIGNIATGKFERARANHYDQLDAIELPAVTIANLDQHFKPGSLDWKFCEALVILASYPANRNEQGELVFIRDDIKRLLKERHGIDTQNNQIERMKKKYITREKEGQATELELLIEKQKGYRSLRTGKAAPSVYAVSLLSTLLKNSKTERGYNSTKIASVSSLDTQGDNKTERGYKNEEDQEEEQTRKETVRGDKRLRNDDSRIRAEYGGIGETFDDLLQELLKDQNDD